MRVSRLCLIAFAVLLTSLRSSAQTYSSGRETVKSDVNFTELANYELAHPVPFVRKPPINEDEDQDVQPNHPAADPSLVHMIHRNAARSINGNLYPSYLPASPAPNDTFLSKVTTG